MENINKVMLTKLYTEEQVKDIVDRNVRDLREENESLRDQLAKEKDKRDKQNNYISGMYGEINGLKNDLDDKDVIIEELKNTVRVLAKHI